VVNFNKQSKAMIVTNTSSAVADPRCSRCDNFLLKHEFAARISYYCVHDIHVEDKQDRPGRGW
jgi:hypothetical protein